MTEQPEEKYHWIVIFRKGSKVYTYQNRTERELNQVVKDHYEKYGVHPYRMWVIADDEIEKVVIT